ncbi:hypothetical protein [Antiquaquibacter soli]|uniref:hypothetical protein n=1 Tax=Antiquaquibacter soli TaxID=3064523 RepID=UPI00272CC141|nr:hypothetical protein [Protaetiibacter sp. WY-16]
MSLLGLPRVINAGAAQSRLGGSTLSRRVLEAMARASTEYVDIEALHDEVGRRLAEATGNESAWVSAGSAAGVMVAVAATIAGPDPERAAALPRSSERPDVAVWSGHLGGQLAGADAWHPNDYLNSIAAGGGAVRVVEHPRELDRADAAFVWFPGMFPHEDEDGMLRLFADAARQLGIPVVVDAADQVPPRSRLTDYTRVLGASLAVFSGGKGIGGPTSSGLVVGTAELVAACRTNSGTEHGVGRTAKIGREELLGLLAAVEEFLERDEDDEYAERLAVVNEWSTAFVAHRLAVYADPSGHCGQLVPRLLVRVPSGLRDCRDDVIGRLWDRSPRVAVLPAPGARIALSPQLLAPDEPPEVARAVLESIAAHRSGCSDCSADSA